MLEDRLVTASQQIRTAVTCGALTRALTRPDDNVYTFTDPPMKVQVRLAVGIVFAAEEG